MPPAALKSRVATNCTNTTSAINGNDIVCILIFKSISEIIHPVLVLPILTPIITPIDWRNVSKPAITNPIVINVVAFED